MRYEHPRSEMHANGIYGGIGSRPAHEAWTPTVHEAPTRKDLIPKAWRRLRLRRTRARPMASEEKGIAGGVIALVFVAAFVVAILLVAVLGLPFLGASVN